MAQGNRIIVSPYPMGRFEEIIVVGTPKPGTHMELVPTTNALVGGRRQMEPAGTTAAAGSQGMNADADNIPICVLLCFADHAACPPGLGPTDAYVTLSRGAVYYPQAGEEMNLLFQNVSGTADDVRIGDKMIVDDGTGKILVSTGSVESESWESQETLTDPTADQLIWCKRLVN